MKKRIYSPDINRTKHNNNYSIIAQNLKKKKHLEYDIK